MEFVEKSRHQSSLWKVGGIVFAVMLVVVIVACAAVARMETGTPASSIACLGNQTQQLVYKGEHSAVFRAANGTDMIVKLGFYHDAPLEVGMQYRVMGQPIMSRMGWFHRFWLKKI